MKTLIITTSVLLSVVALAEDGPFDAIGNECASIWAQTWPLGYRPIVHQGSLVDGGSRYVGVGVAFHKESQVGIEYTFSCALKGGSVDRIRSYAAMRKDQYLAKNGVRPLSKNPVLPVQP